MNLSDFPDHVRKRIEAQIQADDARKVTKLECNLGDAPLAEKEIQRPIGERFLVRIRSRRRRLLDQDNLCEKYAVDLLRYGGVISDDTPERTQIEVSQSKCKKGEREEITIEVFSQC